ncbi:hypothetical protein Asi03nite_67040 [Actinoplanes siamensis]|uniref:Uncharacterized protein n=1 Tax=Actinoplanes siamensis TaxID=1223317 RepID=A0A919NE14_9ACTN|nr:hypothetical protein Asi03nite_67040 [Actinoplanes siamensis]
MHPCPPGVSLIQEMAGTEVRSRHTRKRIKEKAAKNRPASRDGKQAFSEKRPGTKKRSLRSRARRNPFRHGK